MSKPHDIDLLLIRSGPTAWDRDERLCGATDLPLCTEASSSVEIETDDPEHAEAIGLVCTGPEESCRQTATVLSASRGGRIRVIEDLAGVDLGLWEGSLRAELNEKFPRAFKQWCQDPTAVSVPEGEPLDTARERIVSALSRVLERHKASEGPVAVVVRPMAFGLIRATLEDRPLDELWSLVEDAGLVWERVGSTALRKRARRAMLPRAS